MNNPVSIVCFGIGIFFDFFGCLGLLRLPDVYNRLQASTKCVTFGTIFMLVGVLAWSGFTSLGVKALLCLAFILITSPTAAHAIARGAHRSRVKLWKQSVIDLYQKDKEGAASE
jgi:multicomponent Na+:H+ antiporter subunit G